MKRPAGIVLFAGLFFLVGMKFLLGRSAVSDATGVSVLQLTLGVMSLGVAYALWTRRADAMKIYWTWALAWLICGAVAQSVVYEGVPFLDIVIWGVFVAAVFCAVGMYLKGAVRQAVQ